MSRFINPFAQHLIALRLLSLRLSIFALAAFALPSVGTAQQLARGIYAPFDNGVQQWSSTLVPGSQFVLGPSGGMTGAALSSDGLFLTQFYNISAPIGPEFLAINNKGQIVRSVALPAGLDRGSGIVVLPGSGEILTSDTNHILEISPDFSSITTLPFTFGRAAGLALGPDGTLYAVDQDANRIDIINPQLNTIETTVPTGPTPIDVAVGPDDAIYYTDNPSFGGGMPLSQLVRVDLANNFSQSVALAGVQVSDIAFASDGTYYDLEGGGPLDHRTLSGTLLQQVSTPGFSDGIAIVVPEPSSSLLILTAAPLLVRGKKRRHFLIIDKRAQSGMAFRSELIHIRRRVSKLA